MKLQTGQKFGMLTILKWDRQRKAWLCQCDCGGATHARTWALKSGRHTRCGCGKNAPRLQTRLLDNLGAKREILRFYRKAAKKRGYEFLLSEEQFIKLIGERCYYCNSAPDMVLNYYKHAKSRGFCHNGVDRLDNKMGYTVNNSVTCCKICNNAKASLSIEEFKIWIRKIHAYFVAKDGGTYGP